MWPTLKTGDHGAEIGNWQRFLNDQECVDWNARALTIDETFGPRTAYATKQWQTRHQLPPTGVVGGEERVKAREVSATLNTLGFIPFVQAAHCNILYPKARTIDVVTIHTMESSEKPGTAGAVARWFAGPTAPMASAHFCIDPNDVVQCVRETDVAWHAPGCNHNGIGIEHAGYARQTAIDWADEDSLKILLNSAKLITRLLKRYSVPLVQLTPDDLKGGGRGLCGHADATIAFPGPGRTHTDPGEAFPWPYFLDLISQLQRAG